MESEITEIGKVLTDMVFNGDMGKLTPIIRREADDIRLDGARFSTVSAEEAACFRNMYGYVSRVWLTRDEICRISGKRYDPVTGTWIRPVGRPAAPLRIVRKAPALNIPEGIFLNAESIIGLDTAPFEPVEQLLRTGTSHPVCMNVERDMLGCCPTPPRIIHGGDALFHVPETDTIHIPLPIQFGSVREYACALSWGIAHSAMARLDNQIGTAMRFPVHAIGGTIEHARQKIAALFATAIIISSVGLMDDRVIRALADGISVWTRYLTGRMRNPGNADKAVILGNALTEAGSAVRLITGDGGFSITTDGLLSPLNG